MKEAEEAERQALHAVIEMVDNLIQGNEHQLLVPFDHIVRHIVLRHDANHFHIHLHRTEPHFIVTYEITSTHAAKAA